MMNIIIIVKEEFLELLNNACDDNSIINKEGFSIEWSTYSQYVKGFLTVQIDYNTYKELLKYSK